MLKKENANPSSLARKEDTVADHSFFAKHAHAGKVVEMVLDYVMKLLGTP